MRIADILTALRIVATPIIIWLILHDEPVAAYYLFAAGAITDTLDGYFARRSKKKVSYGANFDALADFIFGFLTIFTVVYKGEEWLLLIVTLTGIAFWTPIIILISRKAGTLEIPHLDTNLLAAAVYPTVMVYIINWRYAGIILLFTCFVMLYYMWKYIVFVRLTYKEEAAR
ncbi:MAG: CDP-alcohol phosphatidyltransferase family protein [Deltaproteobacteria bacterium]|nr:CDP-alcohol phosphatidyltransferase family protein [Deltaproteobacteria bacterium]